MSTVKLASMVAAFGVIVGATACKGDRDSTVKGVDTVVTSTKVRDTTVVKSDTTIHTDTVKQIAAVRDSWILQRHICLRSILRIRVGVDEGFEFQVGGIKTAVVRGIHSSVEQYFIWMPKADFCDWRTRCQA